MRVLHAFNIHRGIGGADSARSATITALRRHGIELDEFSRDSRNIPLTLTGKIRAFTSGIYATEAIREFSTRIAERRPDIVHVHELYPLISPWIIPLAARANIPVFMSVYDYRLTCPIATHNVRGEECRRCMGGREYWCLLRNCRDNLAESLAYALRNAVATQLDLYTRHVSRFVAISHYQWSYLTERVGIDPSRVIINPCVVSVPAQPVEDPSLGEYVAFAGRFVPEKGVEIMIDACRKIGLPMAFAGSAPSHPSVRVEDKALFVMTRSPEELAAFYRRARVLVVPSTWPETFGIVAAEAMGHGIPVVASRIGALSETVVDGQTGLLARPGDSGDFADKIAQIWNDPALARRLGHGAYEHVRTNFSDQAHAERLDVAYRDAIINAVAKDSKQIGPK